MSDTASTGDAAPMSSSDVTRDGLTDRTPGREARMWEGGGRRRDRKGGRGGRGERLMVPDATFSSYYGRPIVKKPVWEELDIAGYLFTGGVAGGSALLGAGADLVGLPDLRRVARLTSIGALTVSFAGLVHDLGKPMRFVNMLRVIKPTSPMSVGTWLLTAFAPGIAVAAVSEVRPVTLALPAPLRSVIDRGARPGNIASGVLGAAVATYTAVLFADTSVPTWHESYPEAPFLFAGSALAASSGFCLVGAPTSQTGPVRRTAIIGAALDLAAAQRMESRLGLVGEPLKLGKAGRKLKAARALTAAGAVGTALFARRSRMAAVASGAALIAGSVLTRFGYFEAGVASVEDPKYVVVPQRERLERGAPARD